MKKRSFLKIKELNTGDVYSGCVILVHLHLIPEGAILRVTGNPTRFETLMLHERWNPAGYSMHKPIGT